ncbi:MAG: DegT/DnrJ/EryC1/StrS family aminotransferase [Gemmatimonadetes bacterium]|nr:DegT/DnrJ/EryC1/StrS family aminotransferase [Gemmatimonadota bacterium]
MAVAASSASIYEQSYARAAGVTHAVAFAYARTALVAILHAAGLRRGDEVVLSPLTCKVVPLALLFAGLRPVYADILADTLNLDEDRARAALGSGARAIIFQHTYGWTAGACGMAKVAAEYDVLLVEDCAQCLPSAEANAAGRFGRAAIFSNNPGKPLPAASGGIAITEDPVLAHAVREYRTALPRRGNMATFALRVENEARNQLPPSLYWTAYALHRKLHDGARTATVAQEIESEVGAVAFNIGASEAAEGLRWMSRLEGVKRQRATCCREYASTLEGLPAVATITGPDPGPLYYFPVLVDRKEELLRRARTRRVQLVPWPISTPIYPIEDASALPRYGYVPGSCPVAERIAGRLVGLPTDLTIGPAHRRAVLDLLRDA